MLCYRAIFLCTSSNSPAVLAALHKHLYAHSVWHACIHTICVNNCNTTWVKGFLDQQDEPSDALANCSVFLPACLFLTRCELGLIDPGPDLPPGPDPYAASQWSGGPHQKLQVTYSVQKHMAIKQMLPIKYTYHTLKYSYILYLYYSGEIQSLRLLFLLMDIEQKKKKWVGFLTLFQPLAEHCSICF